MAASYLFFTCLITYSMFLLTFPCSAANQKVTLSLLSTSSATFIVKNLARVFENDLITILNLRMVPWGDAYRDGTTYRAAQPKFGRNSDSGPVTAPLSFFFFSSPSFTLISADSITLVLALSLHGHEFSSSLVAMGTVKEGTRPPWVGLGAAMWVHIAAGNAYNFPLYSHSLKSVLGFSQRQLTMLGVANDIGENVGLIPGIASNKLPPWTVLMIGAFACFFGYGVLWLALSRTVLSMPYWLLWIALCVATNSSAWLTTAVLVTNMRNSPVSRGTVAGILKGYGGLSAAVFTEIYSVLLDNSSSKLLLFLTLGVPILCFIMMYFVRPCTPASSEDSTERGHFLFIQVASVVVGIYVLTTTILDDSFSLSAPITCSFVIIMVVLLMAPLAIPLIMRSSFY